MDRSIWRHAAIGMVCGAALATLMAPSSAEAFCGFYVSQSEGSLYNNATRVAMMREGRQTVMSMQNNYAGPPEDFAMVVPVPEVLDKERVKTLDDGVFDRLDRLTSPRLVEYWQKDPCAEPRPMLKGAVERSAAPTGAVKRQRARAGQQVEVEAQFDVGEYEVVVLSAQESTALDTWLRNHDYNIPDGAAAYFRPYIEQGSYFFVARVDLDKVTYEEGEATLSPLRFHYESDDFKLPVRLGLINSKGSQDLIAYLLGREQRYRVANYPNPTIPTNLPVAEETKRKFGAFYDTLFERFLEDRPEAVVTEYAWTATTCDPCPVEPLEAGHLQTLGADVIDDEGGDEGDEGDDGEADEGSSGGGDIAELFEGAPPPSVQTGRGGGRDWTVTRLHTRYTEESLGEDLQFEKAPPIGGGRGEPSGREGTMSQQTASEASRNNFQARYYIGHGWSGEVTCENPNWDRWGGPPNGSRPDPGAAGDLGFSAPDGKVSLASTVRQSSIPSIGQIGGAEADEHESADGKSDGADGGNKDGPDGEQGDGSDDETETAAASGDDGSTDALPWILVALLFPLAAYGAYRGME